MICDVCGRVAESLMVIGGWWNDGTDTDMELCELCSEILYPGLRELMRHGCPICSGDATP